jgi:hypothetical protein
MNTFIICMSSLLVFVIIASCDQKYKMLRDVGFGSPRPYSYARVQMAWWTLIIFTAFISIYLTTGQIPDLRSSSLYLMGISTATTASSTLVDQSDRNKSSLTGITLAQDQNGDNFFLDILSDKNEVTIHRLQAVVLNAIYGVWFMQQVIFALHHLPDHVTKDVINTIMPDIQSNDLALLGISAGAFVGLKALENKQPDLPATTPDAKTKAGNADANQVPGADPLIVTQKIG